MRVTIHRCLTKSLTWTQFYFISIVRIYGQLFFVFYLYKTMILIVSCITYEEVTIYRCLIKYLNKFILMRASFYLASAIILENLKLSLYDHNIPVFNKIFNIYLF